MKIEDNYISMALFPRRINRNLFTCCQLQVQPRKGTELNFPEFQSRQNIVKYVSRCIAFKYEIINYAKEQTTSELC
jgi:hypothetical protein